MPKQQKDMNQSYAYSGPFKKGIVVANHYGFELVKPARIPADLKRHVGNRPMPHRERYFDPTYKSVVQSSYANSFSKNNIPVTLCNTSSPRSKTGGGINLYVIGSPKSIAEALVIKTAMAILNEHGKNKLLVNINSLGDRGTYKNFLRDFSLHYRRHVSEIDECCRTKMKNDLPLLAYCEGEECKKVRNDAPRSISYLSELGRENFKNVLEYMESLNIPYRINNDLIGENIDFGTQTTFIITSSEKRRGGVEEDVIVARGERYNRYIQSNQSKKTVPTVCISIDLPGGKTESYKKKKNPKIAYPEFYLIHLGIEAKRESLHLIELLRQKNIPILQSITYDGLSEQIRRAENLEVPYTLIMGLKEVKERSIIVRDMSTHAQETIAIPNLLRYLRRIGRL